METDKIETDKKDDCTYWIPSVYQKWYDYPINPHTISLMEAINIPQNELAYATEHLFKCSGETKN